MVKMAAFVPFLPIKNISPTTRTNMSPSRQTPQAKLHISTQTTFASLFPTSEQSLVLTADAARISLVDHVATQNNMGKPVLLGWLRHFGCMLCKKQVRDWQSILPQLSHCAPPVDITLIGNGPVKHIPQFRDEMEWMGHLFTDPDRRTYKALNFTAGILSTFSLPGAKKVVASIKEGIPQTLSRIPTDPFQQGGALLVDKHGIVQMFHADDFAGDHMAKELIVEQVLKAAASEP